MSLKFLNKVTSGARSEPYVAVAMKHWGNETDVAPDDEDDKDDEIEEDDDVEDDEDEGVEEVVDAVPEGTENCVWFWAFAYPDWLAVT
jgi:hypothetical protein